MFEDLRQGRPSPFGPEVDTLLRAIDALAPAEERRATEAMLRAWPRRPDGAPERPEALRDGLAALAADLAAARRVDWFDAAKEGLILGGLAVPAAAVAYLLVALSVPEEQSRTLWTALPVAIGIPAMAGAVFGFTQARRPTRRRRALHEALKALVSGGIAGGVGGLFLMVTIIDAEGAVARLLEESPFVTAGIVMSFALLGGVVAARWRAAWALRRWDVSRKG
ncbi:hypothetical protein [Falsiroseomonas stagni]|uniref:Uncharacterized protein n=1 Tax=Falsiroseomonas stagni DSM 19981 TaxID=1123062 RepID=A0A1I4D3U5_9PROT|nr:hypothetical protein [Falsiroseomonas stagni]SFK86846.1 hypothetical protein SAMN02745775_10940 [Falsiroseomonas stagni DSM 19981]